MEQRLLARIAVSAAVFEIDRPYTYLIPEKLAGKAVPGARVVVPFGRGNRRSEGVVLSVTSECERERLKPIESVLDDEPILSDEMLHLAMWMRERFFCSFYDAVRAMLPAGMWFRDGGHMVESKTQRFVSLAVPGEEAAAVAAQKRLRAPHQADLLSLLASVGDGAVADLCRFTGASPAAVAALEKQGLVTLETREVFRRPEEGLRSETAGPVELTAEQEKAFSGLRELMTSGSAGAALLFGVTGSGKTSVYLKLVREALDRGRTAMVLVPEIGLTPQLVGIFSAHFGGDIAVLHSSLSMGERYDEWRRIRDGRVRVVIGTRSAVFAPLSRIGLIVIDEEQERTYKSENSPRYHAREVAKWRCVRHGALLVLGSATPSVESMYFARTGRYALFTLGERYNERPLPRVVIADMRRELRAGNGGSISSVLRAELEKNLAAGEQSILFINRRGTSGLVVCGECGYTYTCPNCSVSMTYHAVGRRLMCHYCGHTEPAPETCPQCGGKLNFVGAGTQKVEEELRTLFPGAEIARMDTDTVSRSGSHERLLERFRDKRIPILVGTQMVTKGLDFGNVTLVGVLSADQALYVSDFRARERTFSLITQVVGRSGRGEKSGRAVIQTFTPENEIITLAARQDYMSFYEREIALRKLISAPPALDLFAVTASGADEAAVLRGCVKLRRRLEAYTAGTDGLSILGPAPAAVAKVSGRFRYKLTLMCPASKKVRDAIAASLRDFSADKENRGVSAFADADPVE